MADFQQKPDLRLDLDPEKLQAQTPPEGRPMTLSEIMQEIDKNQKKTAVNSSQDTK